ncbi:hypothetical protein [Nocardia miyunensis]|uniref:hypothetical protein n=1 Tax=Nocardia miyunensis TaxID=282684 RepID=UPI00082D20F6|nr:hypothetical protein [Nocardia miyunensis]
MRVRALLQLRHQRMHEVLAAADAPDADHLARLLVAVNQSLAVMHCGGTSPDELRATDHTARATLEGALTVLEGSDANHPPVCGS